MITIPEYENWTDRLRWYYDHDSPQTRPLRPATKLDASGEVEWNANYRSLRDGGMPHEEACQKLLNEIYAIEHPVPVPPLTRRELVGPVQLQTHTLVDAVGPFLGAGFSLFCAPRLFASYPDRWSATMGWARAHAYTHYRAIAETGGWPSPDAWTYAGIGIAEALDVLPRMLDDGFNAYNLRCSLTLFDGFFRTPTFAEQDKFVRNVCTILKARLHTINDVQIVNEYGPTKVDQHPQGVEWMRTHAKTVRQLLGPGVVLGLSSMVSVQTDAPQNEAIAEAKKLFGGGLLSVVNVSVNHDSREMRESHTVETAWRHVRQGWERVIYDTDGTPLTSDASLDDEPSGPRASAGEENDVSRLVQKQIVSYVSGRASHIYHPDAGIWSDLLHPNYKAGGAGYRPPSKGEFVHVFDHPCSTPVATATARLRALLPPDLPNWSRTRHGLAGHPYGASFQQTARGFSQIWPDGVTAHGVTRAYVAYRGKDSVMTLIGLRDRIDLKWTDALTATVYACKSGEAVDTIAAGERTHTIRQGLDTDLVVITKLV